MYKYIYIYTHIFTNVCMLGSDTVDMIIKKKRFDFDFSDPDSIYGEKVQFVRYVPDLEGTVLTYSLMQIINDKNKNGRIYVCVHICM
jgi:hypothetical protein